MPTGAEELGTEFLLDMESVSQLSAFRFNSNTHFNLLYQYNAQEMLEAGFKAFRQR